MCLVWAVFRAVVMVSARTNWFAMILMARVRAARMMGSLVRVKRRVRVAVRWRGRVYC